MGQTKAKQPPPQEPPEPVDVDAEQDVIAWVFDPDPNGRGALLAALEPWMFASPPRGGAWRAIQALAKKHGPAAIDYPMVWDRVRQSKARNADEVRAALEEIRPRIGDLPFDPANTIRMERAATVKRLAIMRAIRDAAKDAFQDAYRRDCDPLATIARLSATLSTLADGGQHSCPTSTLLGVPLSDVEVEDIKWLWHGRIALGKLTMFDGDGGVGKSLVTLDLAARVAMGRAMPDDSPGLDKSAGVVLICGEDGLADTVKPRMLAAGTSPQALATVQAVNLVPEPLADGTISERLLSLVKDLTALESTIRAKGARVLIIDPLTAYLGNGVDAYKDSDIRQVLTPLALMAERTGIAVVCIRHLNRATGATAQHRGLGSVGILNVARLGMLFAPNPDAEGEYLMGRVKGNIGKPPPTLAYRITQVGEAENMPKVQWLGESQTTAEAGLAAQSGAHEEPRTATDEAMEWLADYLAADDRPKTDVLNNAVQDGIIPDALHEKPLRIAKGRLGVKSYREGGLAGKGRWMWRYVACPPGAGHLSENGTSEHATSPGVNGAAAKMPSSENAGHLSTKSPAKMPSENAPGHLSTVAGVARVGDPSNAPILPKMPSPGETGVLAMHLLPYPDALEVLGTCTVSDTLATPCPKCGASMYRDALHGWRCSKCEALLSGHLNSRNGGAA